MTSDKPHTHYTIKDDLGAVTVGAARAAKFIRLTAYSSEVGESYRKNFPKIVAPLYAITGGYIVYDTYNKVTSMPPNSTPHNQIIKATDTLLWHSLASVALPGIAIHQTVKWSRIGMQSLKFGLKNIMRYPPLIGLATIPLIIHPIDHITDKFMDNIVRKVLK